MSNRFAVAVCAALVCLASPLFQAQAQGKDDSKAREAWVLGYMKLQSATDAEEKNNLIEALNLYREARDIFQGVKQNHPDWQSDLVNFRIKFCDTKINPLKAKVATSEDERSKEDLIALNRQLKAALDETTEANSLLEEKVAQLNERVEKAEADQAEKELAAQNSQLQKKLENAEQRAQKFEQEVAQMKARVVDSEELEEQVEKLGKVQEKNEMLEAENKMLRKDNQVLSEGQLSQIREVKTLVESFEARLVRLGEAKEALVKETEKLIQERNNAVAHVEKLQAAIQELGGETPE
jgi:chromosome segregation ATPase